MAADEMELRKEDRLPWLETVAPDEPDDAPLGRVIALVILGLTVLAAIVYTVYHVQHRDSGSDGGMITAEVGDYKVKPDDPGGMTVTGEGTSAVATSDGKTGNGAIDLKAVPEAPIDGRRAQPIPERAAGSRNLSAVVPVSGGKLTAQTPIVANSASAPGAASGGSLVQLGAYPSESVANVAWAGMSKRFAYLTALGKSVQPVATGGKTLYRLRVNAGGANQAADICGRLKVAGQGCFVAF